MKYFMLLTDTPLLFSGAVLSEAGVKKLMKLSSCPVEVTETLEHNANSYEYVPPYEIGADPRCGERNVFHDACGNEWHN